MAEKWNRALSKRCSPVEQRVDGKHSAVRNHDKNDPLADHFSALYLSVI
jgi:hypothetical protein